MINVVCLLFDSQTAKSHLISKNFSLNLFSQLANARIAKKLPTASMDHNLPIEQTVQTHFSQPAVGCERR